MYSLSINYGPTGTVWALLFKDEEKAEQAYNAYVDHKMNHAAGVSVLIGSDDFGQCYAIPFDEIHGMLFENLEQLEQARIQRALADERVKAKFMKAARSDPTIMEAARQGQPGTGVLTPFGRN
jgi:hypothetical protein